MKAVLRYIKLSISALLIASALLVPTLGIAADDPTEKKSAIPETFDVGKYLKVGGNENEENAANKEGKQGQFYYERALELSKEMGQDVSPVGAFIIDVINFLIRLVGSVALLIFIVGALLTIVSEGQEDRIQKGKDAMFYSLIGVVIALMAYFIVTFVQAFFF